MPTKLNRSIDKVIQHLEMIEKQDIQRLDFTWKGLDLSAYIEKSSAGTGSQIILKGKLGRVYYTVENATKRKEALTLLYSKRKKGMNGTDFSLVNRHEIHFKATTYTKMALNGEGLTQALTYILLDIEDELNGFSSTLKNIH